MILSHFLAVSPPGFPVRSPENQRQLKIRSNVSPQLNKKQSKKSKASTKNKSSSSSSLGFTIVKKEPVWQCVKSCGACCKLDKGPSFPSPDEIFDDPSDLEVYFPTISALFLKSCVFFFLYCILKLCCFPLL